MKPSEQAQVNFISDCIRKGEKRGKVLAKFVKNWQKVGTRTFDRRLRQAEKAVHEEQERIKDVAEGEVAKEVDALKSKIMTAVERKLLLTQIANGEVKIPTKEAKWDSEQRKFVMIPFEELAGHVDRIRAVAELNKMGGDYQPTKIDATITEKKLPSWLADESKSKS